MCCWMRKMRVQRASEHDLGSIAQMVPNSIWPSELHRSIERTKCTSQNSSRTFFDTQANHRTPFGAPWRARIAIGIGVGIGCAMAAERWVWANEISIYFSYMYRDQCRTHAYWHGEFARTQISLRNDQHKTASPHAVKALITNAWL